jgi:DNA-binding transcriptional LysR family regulator
VRATLVDYARRFPELELGVVEGSRARLVTALRNGAVDIAIVTGEAHVPSDRRVDSNTTSGIPLIGQRTISNEIFA